MPYKSGMNTTMNSLDEAIALHKEGRFDEAREIYWRVVAEQPDNAEALHGAGVLAYQEGDLDAAVAHLTRAIDASPRHGQVSRQFGQRLCRDAAVR